MTPDRVTRDDAAYEALLESLADGVDVDWKALDAAATTDVERRRYRNLRLVASLAELHRTFRLDDAARDVPVGDEAPALEEMTTWGHLVIRERIGGGARGDVYCASDPELNRDVALRLLRSHSTGSPAAERLLDEARILAGVRHPHMVTVYGADTREGRTGLWMELVHGDTLRAWLKMHGVMSADETITAGVNLCGAVAAVHAAGLVHGDISAPNIMREDEGRLVLMDVGREQGATLLSPARPAILRPKSSPAALLPLRATSTGWAFFSFTC